MNLNRRPLGACRIFAVAVMALAISACEVPPTHPSLKDADLAPLIPLRDFVANTDHVDHFQVSPDGRSLAWTAVRWLRDALVWRDPEGNEDYLRFRKGAPRPVWAADSRHILYHHDPSGWENHHVLALDTHTGEVRDLTPYPGVKAGVGRVPPTDSPYVFVNHNRRDRAVFDVYRIDIRNGEEKLIYRNDGSALTMLLDNTGAPVVRVVQDEVQRELQVQRDDNWHTLIATDRFSALWPIELSADSNSVFILANVDGDKRILQRVSLTDGGRETVYAHPEVDLRRVVFGPRSKTPLAVTFEPGYPSVHFFDEDFASLLAPLLAQPPVGLRIMSLSRDERVGTALTYDNTGASFYRIKPAASGPDAGIELLGQTSARKFARHLATQRPFTFTARDGMTLHGYLTLPQGHASTPLPTVLLVHGGPWSRDTWGYNRTVQMLANRGYAVVRINYRGSSGYGRAYMFAGAGEFARKMQTDLLDGLDWAINAGHSDPDRVAIMGGSYGGYATLVGMTMAPERFACGVDIVGVSDLVTALEDFPPYWKPSMHLWARFVGDPTIPEEREDMAKRSPINFVENVRGPLLIVHGANDPRVRVDQSDRMVARLKAANRTVDYLVFPEEGHGFGHWKNQLTYQRRVEDFLAACLGGRSSGFDFYQLGSWAF